MTGASKSSKPSVVGQAAQALRGEAPVHVVIAGVDLARLIDAIQDGSGRVGIGLDRYQISHLALGGSWRRRSLQASSTTCGLRASMAR